MNVSQGQKGQRPITTINLILEREFGSMSLRSIPLIDSYLFGISNAAQNHPTGAEEATQVLESFFDEISRPDAHPSENLGPTVSSIAPDYPNVYWLTTNNSQRQGGKLDLIREIVDAMPGLDTIRLLYEVFVSRCQGPLGNVVHTPTFLNQAETLYNCLGFTSSESRVMALSNTISMDTIACHLMAVRMPLYTT